MATMVRKRAWFEGRLRWVHDPLERGIYLDALLDHNIATYSQWIEKELTRLFKPEAGLSQLYLPLMPETAA